MEITQLFIICIWMTASNLYLIRTRKKKLLCIFLFIWLWTCMCSACTELLNQQFQFSFEPISILKRILLPRLLQLKKKLSYKRLKRNQNIVSIQWNRYKTMFMFILYQQIFILIIFLSYLCAFIFIHIYCLSVDFSIK